MESTTIKKLINEMNSLLVEVRIKNQDIELQRLIQLCQRQRTPDDTSNYVLKGINTVDRFARSGEWGAAEYEINRLLFFLESLGRQERSEPGES